MPSPAKSRPRTPAPEPRGRPRSAESHAAILDASLALVRKVGYDAVTMEAIAERAEVGKATVYRWWPAKELVIAEAISRLTASIPVPDTGSVQRDVLALMRASVQMYQDPATAHLLSGLVAAMARSAPVARAVRSGFVTRWRTAMGAVLRRGVARGELRPDFDEATALDLLSGPAFHRYLMLGQPVDEPMARRVVGIVLRGLAPEAGSPPARARRTPPRRT